MESETSLQWLFWVVSYADSSLALDDLYCVFKKNASGNTDVSHCGTNKSFFSSVAKEFLPCCNFL